MKRNKSIWPLLRVVARVIILGLPVYLAGSAFARADHDIKNYDLVMGRSPQCFVQALNDPDRSPENKQTSSTSAHGIIKIPFKLSGNRVLLHSRVNGSEPLWLLLDSRALVSAIDERLARDLRLSFVGKSTGRGAGGSFSFDVIRGVTFNLPGLNFTIQGYMRTFKWPASECSRGSQRSGLIGPEFFATFVIQIDYVAQVITLYPQNNYLYSGPGERFHLEIKKNKPYLSARINHRGVIILMASFLLTLDSMGHSCLTSHLSSGTSS